MRKGVPGLEFGTGVPAGRAKIPVQEGAPVKLWVTAKEALAEGGEWAAVSAANKRRGLMSGFGVAAELAGLPV